MMIFSSAMAKTVRLHGFVAVIFSQTLTLGILYGVEAGYNYMIPNGANLCQGNGKQILPEEAFGLGNFTDIFQIPSPSDVLCALTSTSTKSVGFSYEDGSCTIFGKGKGQDALNNSLTYRPFSLDAVSLEEVARHKTTYASPHHQGHVFYRKELGVDGVTIEVGYSNGGYISGLGITNPWFIVDIGQMRMIHQIQIYPRHIGAERFYNIEVRVGSSLKTDGDFSSYTLICTYDGPYAIGEGFLICTRFEPISGRYISIQKSYDSSVSNEYLQIMEVNVFAERP